MTGWTPAAWRREHRALVTEDEILSDRSAVAA
jgi:hypothetical protein